MDDWNAPHPAATTVNGPAPNHPRALTRLDTGPPIHGCLSSVVQPSSERRSTRCAETAPLPKSRSPTRAPPRRPSSERPAPGFGGARLARGTPTQQGGSACREPGAPAAGEGSRWFRLLGVDLSGRALAQDGRSPARKLGEPRGERFQYEVICRHYPPVGRVPAPGRGCRADAGFAACAAIGAAMGSTAAAEADSATYREPFRPQFHFTPAKNWTHDRTGSSITRASITSSTSTTRSGTLGPHVVGARGQP